MCRLLFPQGHVCDDEAVAGNPPSSGVTPLLAARNEPVERRGCNRVPVPVLARRYAFVHLMPMRFRSGDILVLVGQASCLSFLLGQAGRLSHQYLSEIVAYLIAHQYHARICNGFRIAHSSERSLKS